MNITYVFKEFFPDELAKCEVGGLLGLWTAADQKLINVYRSGKGCCMGNSKVATLERSKNPLLAQLLDEGKRGWFEIEEFSGINLVTSFKFTLTVSLGFDEENGYRKKIAKRTPEETAAMNAYLQDLQDDMALETEDEEEDFF